MTEKEMKAQITQAHTDGYNRGYAKAKAELENKIADIKANCDLAIEGRDVKIQELEKNLKLWTDTKDARETIFFQQKRKIAELEKENAELKKEVEKHKWNDIFLEDCAGYDKKIAEEYTTLQERIEKLEKENAELKRRLDNLFNSDCWASEKLTKAKELLEDLVRFQPYIDREAIFHSIGNEWKTAIYKAEQFLKEVEK